MHLPLLWVWLHPLPPPLPLLFIFWFASIYTIPLFVYEIEMTTTKPKDWMGSVQASFHQHIMIQRFFWYDLILFICHFIGALILIHTYYFVIFFFGLLLTQIARTWREKPRNSVQKVTQNSYMNWMCTNIYLLFSAFILLRCVSVCVCWFLSTVWHFHARIHFHLFIFLSLSLSLDIHRKNSSFWKEKKSKIALIYDCIDRFALVSVGFFFVRIEWESRNTHILWFSFHALYIQVSCPLHAYFDLVLWFASFNTRKWRGFFFSFQ